MPAADAAVAAEPQLREPGDRMTGAAEPEARPGVVRRVAAQWPLLIALVLVWCALWQDFAAHVMLTGLLFSVLVVVLFPMPPIPFSGRVNPVWALAFTGKFLVDVVRSSLSVAATVLLRGRTVRSSVVRVPLRSHDDLIITLVGHALALVPGSIVLDVDRSAPSLYLHCLGLTTDEEIAAYREKALRVEEMVVRAVGTREDVELVRGRPVTGASGADARTADAAAPAVVSRTDPAPHADAEEAAP